MPSRRNILMRFCLFRVGDFYETFGEDAIITSQVLGITLTKRNNGALLQQRTGWFSVSCTGYVFAQTGESRIPRCHLRPAGRPKTGQRHCKTRRYRTGYARRATNDKLLEHNSNNFLAALHFNEKRSGLPFSIFQPVNFL